MPSLLQRIHPDGIYSSPVKLVDGEGSVRQKCTQNRTSPAAVTGQGDNEKVKMNGQLNDPEDAKI